MLALALGAGRVALAAGGDFAERLEVLPQTRSSLEIGFDYTTGDYGTGSSTEVLYIPVTWRYDTGPNMFRLTVPWIAVTTQTTGGTIVGMDPMGRPIHSGGTQTRKTQTESGLGDIIAGYGRNLYEEYRSGTYLDAFAKVKFGTADETRGLGTGENDYSLQLDGYTLAGKATLFATVGYKLIGDPPGTNFNNIGFTTVGASVPFGQDAYVGAQYDYWQPMLPSSDSQRDVTFFLSNGIGRGSAIRAYVLIGSGNASPDWGAGASVIVGF